MGYPRLTSHKSVNASVKICVEFEIFTLVLIRISVFNTPLLRQLRCNNV